MSEDTATKPKPTPKKRVAKAAAKKSAPKATKARTTAPSSINVITPDDEGFDPTITVHRGRADVVTPVLDPVLEEMRQNGTALFQFPDGDPFTIGQVRRWAGIVKSRDEGFRLRVSGGNGNNIQIAILEDD